MGGLHCLGYQLQEPLQRKDESKASEAYFVWLAGAYCCRVHPTKSQPPPPPLPPRAATTNTDAVKAEPPDGDSGGEQQQANPSSTSKAAELSLMPAMPGEPLGYSNTRVGQLVVRGPDWAAADGDDDGGAGRIGVVMCVTPAAMAAASPALRNGAPNSACPQPQSQSPQQQPASGGAQVVTVRWCKTGLETTANVRGGTAGSRKFCVAVMEVDVVLLADDGA
eukprot:XP_001703507.1 predicted protein [Chlamydomonas reinhardtii]